MEAIHATHQESWGMTDMATHAWWPYMHRDIITKTGKCNPGVKIGKNLKSHIPVSKWPPLNLCKVPNEEIQMDFGRPIKKRIKKSSFLHVQIDFLNFRLRRYLIEQMQITL